MSGRFLLCAASRHLSAIGLSCIHRACREWRHFDESAQLIRRCHDFSHDSAKPKLKSPAIRSSIPGPERHEPVEEAMSSTVADPKTRARRDFRSQGSEPTPAGSARLAFRPSKAAARQMRHLSKSRGRQGELPDAHRGKRPRSSPSEDLKIDCAGRSVSLPTGCNLAVARTGYWSRYGRPEAGPSDND